MGALAYKTIPDTVTYGGHAHVQHVKGTRARQRTESFSSSPAIKRFTAPQESVIVSKGLVTAAAVRSEIVLTPQRFAFVDSLEDRRLTVVRPFIVELRTDDGEVTAYHLPSTVFGIGDTIAEAITDFRQAIAELYWELQHCDERLGPIPLGTLRILQTHIQPA